MNNHNHVVNNYKRVNVTFIAEITLHAKTEIVSNISKLYNICIKYVGANSKLIKEYLRPNETKIMPDNMHYNIHYNIHKIE
jgi:hypothetical protein